MILREMTQHEWNNFMKYENFYVIQVELTKTKLKLMKSIPPTKVLRIKKPFDIKLILENKLENKKAINLESWSMEVFFSYNDACERYDKLLLESQIIIKSEINKFIDMYNTIENKKIKLRKNKLEKICTEK